jgi:hypothetical protein
VLLLAGRPHHILRNRIGLPLLQICWAADDQPELAPTANKTLYGLIPRLLLQRKEGMDRCRQPRESTPAGGFTDPGIRFFRDLKGGAHRRTALPEKRGVIVRLYYCVKKRIQFGSVPQETFVLIFANSRYAKVTGRLSAKMLVLAQHRQCYIS